MPVGPAGFPSDWLADPSSPASDVELALLLVNTLDLLEDPADRLRDLTWLTHALESARHDGLAGELTARDLPRLRRLRDALRHVFETDDDAQAAAVLNPLLERARAVPLLVASGDGPASLRVGLGRQGIAALEARLPAALAAFVATHGTGRLGVCGSDPCRCVFVDRTRAGTRKYCCSYCNDRLAARAYRRRRRS
ncbi:ABATE domain-containing protein [Nocardioides bigeumensis]|uniref:Zinc finger CGNR domain-containing protein n=1 Tax=Nocardioides bigeumensis TaxID=433657 RepID=A0ABP5KMZ8_9ACTN